MGSSGDSEGSGPRDSVDGGLSTSELKVKINRLAEILVSPWNREAPGNRRTVGAILLLTVVAVGVRLVGLGARIMHYDEGRVAYWGLHFYETGTFEYQYIVHGPFVQHLTKWLFQLVGPSDFVARFPVAFLGGLLPLSALLFRDRLRNSEVVALALFLAFNPVLLYYSRFFRSSILVAGFMFVAFGCFLKTYDVRKPRYLYAGMAAAALGFTAKENAVVYLITWVGAAALVTEGLLFASGDHRSGIERMRAALGSRWTAVRESPSFRRAVGQWAAHSGAATLLAAVLLLYFFAPRTAGEGLGLWGAVADPTMFPDLVGKTVEDIQRGFEYWFGTPTRHGDPREAIEAFRQAFGRELKTLRDYAAVLSAFAAIGTVLERYGSDQRAVVLFAAYWGVASLIGYPIGTDIPSAWIAINGIVPLAIPAAVGVAWLYREGVALPLGDGDRVTAAVFGAVLILLASQVGYAAATGVYLHPAEYDINGDGELDNELVQYAQPGGDFQPARRQLSRVAPANDGVDVLFYGEYFNVEEGDQPMEPSCLNIGHSLPLQWYLRLYEAEAECTSSAADLSQALASGPPPFVFTRSSSESQVREELRANGLEDGYESQTHELRAWGTETIIFVRRSSGSSGES